MYITQNTSPNCKILEIHLIALGLFEASNSVNGKEEANMATSVQHVSFAG